MARLLYWPKARDRQQPDDNQYPDNMMVRVLHAYWVSPLPSIHPYTSAPACPPSWKGTYHPQSGWFEDAPLKRGAVIVYPLRGHYSWAFLPNMALVLPGSHITVIMGFDHDVGHPRSLGAKHKPLSTRGKGILGLHAMLRPRPLSPSSTTLLGPWIEAAAMIEAVVGVALC
jgi:hypothetical protein